MRPAAITSIGGATTCRPSAVIFAAASATDGTVT